MVPWRWRCLKVRRITKLNFGSAVLGDLGELDGRDVRRIALRSSQLSPTAHLTAAQWLQLIHFYRASNASNHSRRIIMAA